MPEMVLLGVRLELFPEVSVVMRAECLVHKVSDQVLPQMTSIRSTQRVLLILILLLHMLSSNREHASFTAAID